MLNPMRDNNEGNYREETGRRLWTQLAQKAAEDEPPRRVELSLKVKVTMKNMPLFACTEKEHAKLVFPRCRV